MKRLQKKVIMFILTIILVAASIPFEKLSVHAEEGPDENVITEAEETPVLGAVSYKVGDIIKFGKYEQDGNASNGKEPIEWQILKVEDDRILVISKYCLDCKQYNPDPGANIWVSATLRQWLNNEFLNSAFSASEKAKLLDTPTLDDKNIPFMVDYYGATDKVFCLSAEELSTLFEVNKRHTGDRDWFNINLIAEPTPYAISQGAADLVVEQSDYDYIEKAGYPKSVIGKRGTWWWLRRPGYDFITEDDYYYSSGVDFVTYTGCVRNGCASVSDDTDVAVRPAMYIRMPLKPTGISLNKTSANMFFGESLTLSATLSPADVIEKTVYWSLDNPSIASVNNGVVKVWGAGNVKVTAKTVNGLTATCNILVLAENNPSNPFADVKSGDWKFNAAKYVYEKGYMNGKGNLAGKVLFSPDTPINRSMFVQTLYNVEGKPAVTYVQKFGDVKESDWYAKPVTWAAQNGIVVGNANGTFGVNGVATREQLAQMFYKYAVYKGFDVKVKSGSGKRVNDFPDADKVSSWAVNPLNWALSRGIMSGKGSGKLDPKGSATRVECATMLRNFMNAYNGAVPKLSSVPELSEEDLLTEEIAEKEALAPEDMPEEDIAEEKVQEEKETSDEDAIQNEDTVQNEDAIQHEDTIQDEDTTQDKDMIQENDTVQNEESIQAEDTIVPEASKIE